MAPDLCMPILLLLLVVVLLLLRCKHTTSLLLLLLLLLQHQLRACWQHKLIIAMPAQAVDATSAG
jgi:hypothetical protein